MKFVLPVLALCALSAPLQAQNLYVDRPEGCDIVMFNPDGDLEYMQSGGMILDQTGYGSMEFSCSFEPKALYQWQVYDVSTHYGHCEMPGPEYVPRLFTIVRDPDQPGVISIHTGAGQPVRFYGCSS